MYLAWETPPPTEHTFLFAGTPYLHKSCVPLDQLDLSTREERGQLALDFADECSGVCGV